MHPLVWGLALVPNLVELDIDSSGALLLQEDRSRQAYNGHLRVPPCRSSNLPLEGSPTHIPTERPGSVTAKVMAA